MGRFEKQDLDVVLVPCGLILMFGYHLVLLYRYLRLPHTTVMGFENHDKRAWVHSIMQVERKDVGSYLGVVSSNVSAATFLSSVSLTLSSLIGAWISSSSSNGFLQSELIYGDTRPTTVSIKYVSLLVCFLLAFSCFVQSSRSYVHANYLISIPGCDPSVAATVTKAAELAIVRGSDFWSVGLRALYFALVMLFWFFGPIPMFAASMAMVIVLYYLDHNSTPLIDHRFSGIEAVKEVEERISQSVAEVAMAIQVRHRH
ncbi:hypothetical protein MLD38_019314 [Melastoma candidum]|uniref:Uncharacterized protein n=1 Tax=Melastoma candidum TaxID=119954 RepID=A0ACB9QWK1_9MYRT|nr:hypothetical protein MLD38_019314 [Melastoma candidum]